MLIEAILAGIVVSLGTIAYMYNPGPMGALLYSITILSIVYYDLDLFVGRSGLLTNKNLDFFEQIFILFGNLIGAMFIGTAFFLTPNYGLQYMEYAEDLLDKHMSYGIDGLFIVSTFSGMVMYAGIIAYRKAKISTSWVMLCLPIMMCVLCRWPFVVAEFFIFIGVRWYWKYWYYLIPIFFGNLFGANLFPLLRRNSPRFKDETIEEETDKERMFRQIFHRPPQTPDNKDTRFDK